MAKLSWISNFVSQYIERIALFATCIAAIATCVSACISQSALEEVREQRETTYRPDILLTASNEIGIGKLEKVGSFTKNSPPAKFADLISELQSAKIKKSASDRLFKIYNLGLGASKNISIKWDYDYKSIFNSIEKSARSSAINARLDTKNTSSESRITIYLNEIEVYDEFIFFNDVDSRDYILPASIDKNGQEFDIPFQLLGLVKLKIMLDEYNRRNSNNPLRKSAFEDTEKNIASVEVSYEDIAEKIFSKKYRLSFGFGLVRNVKNPNDFQYTIFPNLSLSK